MKETISNKRSGYTVNYAVLKKIDNEYYNPKLSQWYFSEVLKISRQGVSRNIIKAKEENLSEITEAPQEIHNIVVEIISEGDWCTRKEEKEVHIMYKKEDNSYGVMVNNLKDKTIEIYKIEDTGLVNKLTELGYTIDKRYMPKIKQSVEQLKTSGIIKNNLLKNTDLNSEELTELREALEGQLRINYKNFKGKGIKDLFSNTGIEYKSVSSKVTVDTMKERLMSYANEDGVVIIETDSKDYRALNNIIKKKLLTSVKEFCKENNIEFYTKHEYLKKQQKM